MNVLSNLWLVLAIHVCFRVRVPRVQRQQHASYEEKRLRIVVRSARHDSEAFPCFRVVFFSSTKEKIINSDKVKKYFKKRIIPSNLKLGYKVESIKKKNNKIILNNDLECDILIDCSYNQLNLSKKKYIYEITISLLYDRINFDLDFESLTIMDGNFFSLFPRDISKKQYTLTHVKYTPIFSSQDIESILNYKFNESKLSEIKKNMENEVLKIYESFNSHFEYNSYFLSFKCKLKSNTGTRECIIEDNDNVISVNCGYRWGDC